MVFYITDKVSNFESNRSDYKFLFKGWMIEKWNLPFSTDAFNITLNCIEFTAADNMLKELSIAIDKLENETVEYNKFIATRKNKRDIHFSLLYKSFWNLVIKKEVLKLVIQKLLVLIKEPISQISIELDLDYKLAELDFEQQFNPIKLNFSFASKTPTLREKVSPLLKNLWYWSYFNFKKISPSTLARHSGKKNILFLVYDVQSFHRVLAHFYELVQASSTVHLTIVVMSSGISNAKSVDVKKLESKNISVLDYSIFRRAKFWSHKKLYKILESWHPAYAEIKNQGLIENLENHYAWMSAVFERVPADVCLSIGIASETGRAISDTARYYGVKSINVEYGINTDDPLYCSYNTKYDIRACVAQSNIDIWKRRNDPSEKHIPIGFCKLDELKGFEPNAAAFYSKYKLNPQVPTVFFASSWTAGNKSYDIEKQTLITELSDLCKRKNWNLIIKKHPAETDTIVEGVLTKNNFSNQRVFQHNELGLHEAISYCTVATTQSSSMFAETLYFGKPFCFLSKMESGGITDLYTSINADGLFETYRIRTAPLIEKYIYKTDGLASQRLLDLLEKG
jgi:hypothetical protein